MKLCEVGKVALSSYRNCFFFFFLKDVPKYKITVYPKSINLARVKICKKATICWSKGGIRVGAERG